MRTGNCAVQQGLTAEAASIVKQAVALAKRRGHAQVTPLHVASTMLSAPNGLLRRACLQSHSHPLQCKALELCFNVALNRLPASPSSSSSMLQGAQHHHHHSQCPQISNALVAAFKRAQAHQRRGSMDSQQQPLLAVKIELEQLVISILDDPSVSRVMREAGFSSTQVKSNVEQAVSLEICNSQNAPSSLSKENNQVRESVAKATMAGPDPIREEDVASVIDNLGKQKRRSVVIVGESVACLEGVVRGVMDKVDKGDVSESLKGVKFVSLSLSSFSHVSRAEAEHKVEEVRMLAQTSSCNGGGRGYVLYLGDLKWVFEYRGRSSSQCPVDHMVMEIGKLVSGECGRFWVMGIATFRDYMRCKNGNPSVEALWGLHPITIPAATLRLALITHHHSGPQNQSSSTSKKCDHNGTRWLLHEGSEDDQKQPCCLAPEPQVRDLQGNSDSSSSSSLPAWLQQCKNESKASAAANDQNCVQVGDLCKKWNSMCSSIQTQPYPSVSPSSAFSPNEPTLRMYIPDANSHPNSNPKAAAKFKEFNSENLKTLTSAMGERVPWQRDMMAEIASTVLQCRSGMTRRRGGGEESNKEDTWLLFEGADVEAKEKIARELARVVFGSESSLVSIALSSYSAAEDSRNKRSRDERSCSYINRLAEAVGGDPHRVFMVEDVEQADYCSQVGFVRAMERGRVEGSNGEQVGLRDAIVVLSCERFSSRSSRACSPSANSAKREGSQDEKDDSDVADLEETSGCGVSLDLNISIDDDDDHSGGDDIGLLESVDRRFVFRI